MNTKRVDRLERGDRIAYCGRIWTVTRIRHGSLVSSRTVRLRDIAEPHDVVERDFPNDTHIEVVP